MDYKHYRKYTIEDFILDEKFNEIVREEGTKFHLDEMLENLPEKKYEIDLAIQILNGLQTEQIQQSELRKQLYWKQIRQYRKRKVFIPYYLKIAATILLLVGVWGIINYLKVQKLPDELIAVVETQSNDAQLILANGKSINIQSQQSTVQYSADGSGIVVDGSPEVAQSVSEDVFNQLIVPFGKRSYIELSEGTKVWLNSGSRLIFPPVFKNNTREVFVEGEAFFDVAKNAEKPFFVKTDFFRMKVYGTKFNVQAYQQDTRCNIVLVEGKVSMNSVGDLNSPEIFLAPSQKASIEKGEKTFDVTNIENTEVYTAWIDGYLTFTNEDVSDVLKRISRYYNVDITCQLPEDFEKIYGKLDLKTDMDRVLEGIAFISNTNYQKQDTKYVFMSK